MDGWHEKYPAEQIFQPAAPKPEDVAVLLEGDEEIDVETLRRKGEDVDDVTSYRNQPQRSRYPNRKNRKAKRPDQGKATGP